MSSLLIRLLTLFIVTTLNLFLCLPAKAATHKSSELQTMQTHSKSKNPMSVLLGKAEQLNLLYDKYWDDSMRLNPLQATLQGDAYHGDRMPNFLSAEFRKQHHDFIEKWLKKVEMVGADGLDGQAFISYQIFVRDARNSLHAERYPNWMLPINQFYNIANVAVVLGSGNGAQPFNTVQDYDNWAHRSLGIPALFNQAIVNMRLGMKSGVVQPKVLMERLFRSWILLSSQLRKKRCSGCPSVICLSPFQRRTGNVLLLNIKVLLSIGCYLLTEHYVILLPLNIFQCVVIVLA